MVFFPEITDRPARRRPGPCLADRAGRQAGARADRTTRRLGGRKAGESAATDLPGSATVVLARSEWQAVELSGGTVEYKPSLRSGYKKSTPMTDASLCKQTFYVAWVHNGAQSVTQGTSALALGQSIRSNV